MGGILDSLKNSATAVVKKVKKVNSDIKRGQAKRRKANIKAANDQKRIREGSLVHIRKIAKEFGAKVEPYDTTAYVYKGVGQTEKGAHIKYGTHNDEVRAILEKKLVAKSTTAKLIHGIRSASRSVKAVQSELKKAGVGKSSMYGDPKDMYKF